VGSRGFEHQSEDNLKWKIDSTVIIDLGSVKLNMKLGATVNRGALSGSSAVYVI
jgi:hypothetical protein